MKKDLSNQGLTTIDGIDLTGVTELNCGYNQLVSLPVLPDSLQQLYCDDNQLVSLPVLPDSLQRLNCDNNSLPDIIPWGLQISGFKYDRLLYINTKRKQLGLEEVLQVPNKEEWDEINRLYINFLYRPDGEKYKQSEKEFKECNWRV